MNKELFEENEIDSSIFIEKNLKINSRYEIYVEKIRLSSQPTYMNLLVRNIKNNQLISFEPVILQINKSILKIVIFVSVLICFLIIVYSFYDQIKSDLMGCYTFINSFFQKKKEVYKYSNLSDNYD